MQIDPYLKSGTLCIHENNGYKTAYYFVRYSKRGYALYADIYPNDHGRQINPAPIPANTEWDYAPTEAICGWDAGCVAVTRKGIFIFWDNIPNLGMEQHYFSEYTHHYLECGICPDKSRYEGDAWKILRMRPAWAGGKNE